MNYINSIKIALSALKRNKFRAFLTMLGIIIGVASVIVMLAIGQGVQKEHSGPNVRNGYQSYFCNARS